MEREKIDGSGVHARVHEGWSVEGNRLGALPAARYGDGGAWPSSVEPW